MNRIVYRKCRCAFCFCCVLNLEGYAVLHCTGRGRTGGCMFQWNCRAFPLSVFLIVGQRYSLFGIPIPIQLIGVYFIALRHICVQVTVIAQARIFGITNHGHITGPLFSCFFHISKSYRRTIWAGIVNLESPFRCIFTGIYLHPYLQVFPQHGSLGALNRANLECQPPLGDCTARLVKVRSHSLSCPGHTIPIENQFIFLDGLSVCQLVTFQTGSR